MIGCTFCRLAESRLCPALWDQFAGWPLVDYAKPETPKESRTELNLHHDSGPWCVSSCGPSSLHTHTNPLWYKLSMSEFLPASLFSSSPVFQCFDSDALIALILRFIFVACFTHSLCPYCKRRVCSENVSPKTNKKKKKENPCRLTCPAVTPSCLHLFPSVPSHPHFLSRCASVDAASGRYYWEWTLQL